jgi:two-component system chemotaxis response regulator CheY
MRRILRHIVEPLGFQILEASNGAEALQKLAENGDTELVLVDWNMPEMNGIDFVEKVREDDDKRNLKLVMVTSETEATKMARAMLSGADEFLMKPFTAEMLIDKLVLIGVPIQN